MKKLLVPMICRILGIVIIAAVILSALVLTVPKIFGRSVYHVESGSMAPAIPVGSVIYVKAVEPETIQPGDIITYALGGSTITHRVVENRFVEGEMVTKGDANEQEDIQLVPYANIVGNGGAQTRSNAYALDWDGNGHFAGDVYVGCNADSSGGTM